jgi:hypothetical protein
MTSRASSTVLKQPIAEYTIEFMAPEIQLCILELGGFAVESISQRQPATCTDKAKKHTSVMQDVCS